MGVIFQLFGIDLSIVKSLVMEVMTVCIGKLISNRMQQDLTWLLYSYRVESNPSEGDNLEAENICCWDTIY